MQRLKAKNSCDVEHPPGCHAHCQICLNVIRFASLTSCHLELPQAAGLQMAKLLQGRVFRAFFFFLSTFSKNTIVWSLFSALNRRDMLSEWGDGTMTTQL